MKYEEIVRENILIETNYKSIWLIFNSYFSSFSNYQHFKLEKL